MEKMNRILAIALTLAFLFGLCAFSGCGDAEKKIVQQNQSPTVPDGEDDAQSQSLFDGQTLNGWERVEFGGEGDVEIIDSTIHMYAGDPLTAICVSDETELPTRNYELSLEAMILEGSDFFASVTFPVEDSFCTLVVGGWGGSLVGLSTLDGRDASENETRVLKSFDKEVWYAIRIQVMENRIVAWIDDEKLVDQPTKDVEVSIRNDVISTTPLGIMNYGTSSACLLYTSPSPRDATLSRMPSSA